MWEMGSTNKQQGCVNLFSINNSNSAIKTKKIGIPRGLFYYEHGEVWERFFKQLGFDVVFSAKTNVESLNNGVVHCTNDTCLPVKVFHGLVLELKDKTDFIFVPRYSSICQKEYSCPKLCGLPDMVMYNLKNKLNIFEIKINENCKKETYSSLKDVSILLGVDYQTIITAYENIVGKNLKNEGEFIYQPIPSHRRKIAILGHPYMIYDEYLSMNLINKLTKLGYLVCTPNNIQASLSRANAYPYNNGNKPFYSVGIENIGSLYTFLAECNLCGIIYLTPFACGVDSIVIEFIERSLQKRFSIPFMKLTVDEHTGEAGFDTRLEAFFDMIV